MIEAASAPGKLFILGEYAVLAGGPALVTASARCVRVSCRTDDQGYRIEGSTFADPRRLPELVSQALPEQPDFDHLTVDLRELYSPSGEKLGLGSSAASTVALLRALAPKLDSQQCFETAFQVHRRLQDGRGSGADIAASTFGGTLAFYLKDKTPPFDEIFYFSPPPSATLTSVAALQPGLSLPPGLKLHAVWTGKPAKTVSFMGGVRQALAENRFDLIELFEAIAETARHGIDALGKENAPAFIAAIEESDRLMEALGVLCRLPIVTDIHRELRSIARATGFATKPSGAGGGDFSLLIGPEDLALPEVIEENFLVISAGL